MLSGSPANHQHRNHGNRSKKPRDTSNSREDQKRTLPPNIWALLASNKRARDDESSSKYNRDIEPSHDMNEIVDDLSDFELSNDDESIKKVNCPKCKQNSVKMSENELTNLRIEYVKNQILHKLKLTERPAPISKDELPEPVQEGYAFSSIADVDTEFLNRHLDDYFAKTTQKIIFLSKGNVSHKVKISLKKCVILLNFFLYLQNPKNVNRMSLKTILLNAFHFQFHPTLM